MVTSTNIHEDNGTSRSFSGFNSQNFSKSPIVFAVQTVLIFIVVGTALVNLSINSHDDPNSKLWIMLLSASVGYFLPNPSIKLFQKN